MGISELHGGIVTKKSPFSIDNSAGSYYVHIWRVTRTKKENKKIMCYSLVILYVYFKKGPFLIILYPQHCAEQSIAD